MSCKESDNKHAFGGFLDFQHGGKGSFGKGSFQKGASARDARDFRELSWMK